MAEASREPTSVSSHLVISFKETVKKIPWLDIALVVGIVALATIAALTHYGVINPAFKLPYIGTISAKFVNYFAAFGAYGLLLIETGRLGFKAWKSAMEAHPAAKINSSNLWQEEAPSTISALPEEASEKIHSIPFSKKGALESVSEEEEKFVEFNTSVKRSIAKSPDVKLEPSEHTFVIAGQSVTLYGIYPPDSTGKEEIVKELQDKNSLNLDDLQEILKKYDYDIALDIGEKLIVSARNYIYCGVDRAVSQKNDSKMTWDREKNPKTAFLLGTSETITKIGPKQFRKTVNDTKLTNDKKSEELVTTAIENGASEVSFIFINLEPTR